MDSLAWVALAFVALKWITQFRMGYGITQWCLSLIPLMLALSLLNNIGFVKSPAWCIWLGNISYSLYLFHPLVQEGYDAQRWLPPSFRDGIVAFFVTTVLCLGVATVSYRLLERGLCAWLQERLLSAWSR